MYYFRRATDGFGILHKTIQLLSQRVLTQKQLVYDRFHFLYVYFHLMMDGDVDFADAVTYNRFAENPG